ncbi:brachyurin-like [Tenebrio molitor]|jgi:V8-like Glu-specific endopeptidase|uniref:brachyurin-like n=1 Tax=Tenebrio molitor TaxID=7067 RepID=UPI0036247645
MLFKETLIVWLFHLLLRCHLSSAWITKEFYDVVAFLNVVKDPPGSCTGVLIPPQYVLTAAHCVEGASDIDILFGTTNLQNSSKFYTNTSRIIIHELYSNTTYDHDIALVRLYTSFSEDSFSITYPLDESLNKMSSTLFVLGWGEKGEFSGNLSPKNVTLVDSTDCTSYYKSVEVDGKSKFCVVSQNGLCHGDSGGPVFNPRDLDHLLIGIVSAGHTNCSEATPTVCINVVYYTMWILNQMSDEERMAVPSKNLRVVINYSNIITIIIIIIIIYYRVSGRLHNRKINLFIIIIIILKMYYNYLNMPPLPGGCWAFLPEYIHNYRKIMTMY